MSLANNGSNTASPERFRTLDEVDVDIGDFNDFEEFDGILPSAHSSTRKTTDLSSTTSQTSSTTLDSAEASSILAEVQVAPLIRLPTGHGPIRRFKVLQQFEGVVTELSDDSLIAELIDLTDKSKRREVAEIPLSEISPADQPLVEPGCVFYWIMGYETTTGGQQSRVSEIRFRRSPRWSPNEIEAIKKEGQELFDQFGNTENISS